MKKNFVLLLVAFLVPSCLIIERQPDVVIGSDLNSHELQKANAMAERGYRCGLGIAVPALSCVLFGHSAYSASDKEKIVVANRFISALMMVGYLRRDSTSYDSVNGKIVGEDFMEGYLLGLVGRWSEVEKQHREHGWQIGWGFLKHKVVDGKSDWTFLWFI